MDASECKNIDDVRNAIDKLDSEILTLFSKRQEFVERIVDFKDSELSIIAPERQKFVLQKIRTESEKLGINPDLFEKLYHLLIQYNIKEEIKIFNDTK